MRTYEIVGETVSISTEVENERYIRVETDDLIVQAVKALDAWYSSQGDVIKAKKNIDNIIISTLLPICKKGVSILAENGIYSIDENMFFKKYVGSSYGDIDDLLDEGVDRVQEIEQQKQAEIRYRQARKDSRGRVVGGGFGLGGAVKGMATAGVINATTGMGHSLINAVGNMGTSMAAGASKASVYSGLKGELHGLFVDVCYCVPRGIRAELEKININCKYVTVGEYDQAQAIIKNYKEGRIPEDQKKKQIVAALQLNPYSMSVYELIWNDYGDPNGDLSKMCKYFGGALEEYIKRVSEQYGDEIFTKHCDVYEKAFDKKQVEVACEENIQTALDTLVRYCDEHGLSQESIPHIQRCRTILEDIDRDLKTAHGTVYETRELAQAVRKDYQLFYGALKDRKILDKQVYDEVKSLNFVTTEFRNQLRGLYEREQERRKPERIKNSLEELLAHNLEDEIVSGGWINIGEKAMEQKLPVIKTVTSMPTEEVPLVLIGRSDNGKSGVLITNLALRVYSKGLLFTENKSYPIETIEEIKCIDADKYSILIKDQESVNIPLKRGKLSPENQIALGYFINKATQMINNLYFEDRQRLYRILNAAHICVCGEYLLPGETICPSCRRMLTDSGDFVETQECPDCHSLVLVGKRFCSTCGYSFCGEMNGGSVNELITVNEVVEDNCLQSQDAVVQIEEDGSGQEEGVEQKEIQESESAPIEFLNCPNCGYQVPFGKKFCSRCGSPILKKEDNNNSLAGIRCRNCGNLIKPGKKFCTACGTPINEKGEHDNE